MSVVIAVSCTGISASEIITKTIDYTHGNVRLQGYYAYNDTYKIQKPGILIIHDWDGLGEYEKRRARELAEIGYPAFAADIYGIENRPENRQESAAQSGIYKKDRELFRARLREGLEVLTDQPQTDPAQVAAIGYCFGGSGVLELARSGADIDGVVSFHGNLDTPDPKDAHAIKAQVLVLHGADDPYVPHDQIDAFMKEMNDAGVDWQMNYYSGAVHAFTVPEAGDDPSTGAAYNKKADHRAWEAMKLFFNELWGNQ
ncbi:MAG: dienelactone hydrolase family protein [Elusimicrobia bacterium]|nr:dienelactone hydrolase family protein [Elusimicrobiota bacterium]MBD3412527.1 dienelactone hydrolase family protein [Elusimicrobiota bacterium]